MKLRMVINSFRLIVLYSMTLSAYAGSSATAITTISANIVPAASFTVSSPILLNQRLPDSQAPTTGQHQDHTSKSSISNRIPPGAIDAGSPAKLSVDSSKNLVYDVSVSPQINAAHDESNITANISYTLEDDEQGNPNSEYKLEIDGSSKDISDQSTGAYRGLIDITINYN